MGQEHIFISHSSKNDVFVKKLRETLELFGELPWVDSRELTGGDELEATIEKEVRSARYFLVVISIDALSSEWVQKEVKMALDEATKRMDGYKVISVVLPGVQAGILKLLFPKEPVHIFIEDKPTGFDDAMPKIFAALGHQLPEDWETSIVVTAEPIEELILKLTKPTFEEKDGTRRAVADAELTYISADKSRSITSYPYCFIAPVGTLELDDVRWYIEKYYQWPTGVFKTRAKKTEDNLPKWGKALYDAALAQDEAREPLEAWSHKSGNRRFSVQVDSAYKKGTKKAKASLILEASSDLLLLPWEIMHDGVGYLSQGANAASFAKPKVCEKPASQTPHPCAVTQPAPRSG